VQHSSRTTRENKSHGEAWEAKEGIRLVINTKRKYMFSLPTNKNNNTYQVNNY